MKDKVINLFEQGKILARAMENPNITRISKTNSFYYDFSDVIAEFDEARTKGKDCASTTLIMSGKKIPTYRAYGFLIDSKKTDLIHISERDSGSSGEISKGDFRAYTESLSSLDELSQQIREEDGSTSMNEVNVCMKDDAYIGIFTNPDKRSIAFGIILQKLNDILFGAVLPLYMYEKNQGQLISLDLDISQKIDIIRETLQNKRLTTSDIFYQLGKEENYIDILEELENEKLKQLKEPMLLDSAIDATEETIRTNSITEQITSIEQLTKGKNEKSKGMEI